MSEYRIDVSGSPVSNWRDFKAVIEKQKSPFDEYYFVYREDWMENLRTLWMKSKSGS
ncbi:hypothetical protein [Brevibacillus borstelensis]|uniref:hypothetical protein n=1 Tax=Brevibacillus borstelensis TaxID=45462 RepID=UPI0030BF19A6